MRTFKFKLEIDKLIFSHILHLQRIFFSIDFACKIYWFAVMRGKQQVKTVLFASKQENIFLYSRQATVDK